MSYSGFSVSPEASSWIIQKLQEAESDPALAGLIPGLYFFLGEEWRDEHDQLVESIQCPFFDICWNTKENAIAEGYMEIEMLGVKLIALPNVLERLQGKQLVLDTIEVKYPTPDNKRQLLKAVE